MIDGDAAAPAVKTGIDRLRRRWPASRGSAPRRRRPTRPATSPASVPIDGDPPARRRSTRPRAARHVPAAFGRSRRQGLRDRPHGRNRRLHPTLRRWLPVALAFVLEPELRAPAGRLPLDRHPGEGDRHEPAVRRRRLRPPGPRLPEGRRRRAASASRRSTRSRPGCPSSSSPALRALDGLPGLPAQPHQGAL